MGESEIGRVRKRESERDRSRRDIGKEREAGGDRERNTATERYREGERERMCYEWLENDRGIKTGQTESYDFLSCEKCMQSSIFERNV